MPDGNQPPETAMPIIECLRRDVPRPQLPTRVNRGTGALRWWIAGEYACPIGLHPAAEKLDPHQSYHVFRFLHHAIPDADDDPEQTEGEDLLDPYEEAFYDFIKWWDEQADPKAAVDAIWGPSSQDEEVGGMDG